MPRIIYNELEEAARLFNPPAPTIGGYEAEQLSIRNNFERLKQLRRERELSNQHQS
jgi:hypothetical protein